MPNDAHAHHRPILVIVAGPPAGGKGTVCEHLVADIGLVQISTGDLLRDEIARGTEAGSSAMKLMRAGRLVPEEIVNGMVFSKLETAEVRRKGAILDGFPRTESQAAALADYCKNSNWWRVDAYIAIDVPDAVLLERAAGRRIDPVTKLVYHVKFNPPPADIAPRLQIREDDKPDRQRRRISTYRENAAPIERIFNSIIVHIDGNQPMSGVYNQFVEKMVAACWGEKSGRKPSTIPEKWNSYLAQQRQKQQQSKL